MLPEVSRFGAEARDDLPRPFEGPASTHATDLPILLVPPDPAWPGHHVDRGGAVARLFRPLPVGAGAGAGALRPQIYYTIYPFVVLLLVISSRSCGCMTMACGRLTSRFFTGFRAAHSLGLHCCVGRVLPAVGLVLACVDLMSLTSVVATVCMGRHYLNEWLITEKWRASM